MYKTVLQICRDFTEFVSATRGLDVWHFWICSKAGDTETVGLTEISFHVTCLAATTRLSGAQTL